MRVLNKLGRGQGMFIDILKEKKKKLIVCLKKNFFAPMKKLSKF